MKLLTGTFNDGEAGQFDPCVSVNGTVYYVSLISKINPLVIKNNSKVKGKLKKIHPSLDPTFVIMEIVDDE